MDVKNSRDSMIAPFVCFVPGRWGGNWFVPSCRIFFQDEIRKLLRLQRPGLGCWFRRWDVIGWRQSKLLLLVVTGSHWFCVFVFALAQRENSIGC